MSIKLLSDVPQGAGSLGEARRAAGYLSRYVSKSFEDQATARRHRYDVAQGVSPAARRGVGAVGSGCLEQAAALFGGALPQRRIRGGGGTSMVRPVGVVQWWLPSGRRR